MAQRESKRAQSSTSVLRQREEYRGLGGPEELHHQQVESQFSLQKFFTVSCFIIHLGGPTCRPQQMPLALIRLFFSILYLVLMIFSFVCQKQGDPDGKERCVVM